MKCHTFVIRDLKAACLQSCCQHFSLVSRLDTDRLVKQRNLWRSKVKHCKLILKFSIDSPNKHSQWRSHIGLTDIKMCFSRLVFMNKFHNHKCTSNVYTLDLKQLFMQIKSLIWITENIRSEYIVTNFKCGDFKPKLNSSFKVFSSSLEKPAALWRMHHTQVIMSSLCCRQEGLKGLHFQAQKRPLLNHSTQLRYEF